MIITQLFQKSMTFIKLINMEFLYDHFSLESELPSYNITNVIPSLKYD